MRKRLKHFFKENKWLITLFFIATLSDATSTILAKMKPGTTELNPISAMLLQPELSLKSIGLLSIPPLVGFVTILILWARFDIEDYMKTLLEAFVTIQIVASINNTLLYLGYKSPIPILLLAAMVGHYFTRFYNLSKPHKQSRLHLKGIPTKPLSEE